MYIFIQNHVIMFNNDNRVTYFKMLDDSFDCRNGTGYCYEFSVNFEFHKFTPFSWLPALSNAYLYFPTAWIGSAASKIPDKTAIPAAPAVTTSFVFSGVIPPIAITGIVNSFVIS